MAQMSEEAAMSDRAGKQAGSVKRNPDISCRRFDRSLFWR